MWLNVRVNRCLCSSLHQQRLLSFAGIAFLCYLYVTFISSLCHLYVISMPSLRHQYVTSTSSLCHFCVIIMSPIRFYYITPMTLILSFHFHLTLMLLYLCSLLFPLSPSAIIVVYIPRASFVKMSNSFHASFYSSIARSFIYQFTYLFTHSFIH